MTGESRRITRSQILQAAAGILDAGVYSDLTVEALARALHMSKSTLYNFFVTKEDVVVALIEEACDDAEAALDRVDLERAEPRAALEALVDLLAGHADRVPRALVLQQARLPAACQERMRHTHTSIGHALHRALARAVRSGAFGFHDATLAATSFMAGADAGISAAARGEVAGGRGGAVRALFALYSAGMSPSPVAA